MVVLARFPEHASQTVLPKDARGLTDLEVKAHLLYELSYLLDDGPGHPELLQELLSGERSAVIQFAAACSDKRRPAETPPEAVQALVALLPLVRNDTRARHENTQEQGKPFYLYRSLSTVVDALERVEPKVAVPALARLLPNAEEMAWHGADKVVKAMLSQAFGQQIEKQSVSPGRIIRYRLAPEDAGRQPLNTPKPGELTPWRREALEALVKRDDAWLSQSNLLELLGLPTSREGVDFFFGLPYSPSLHIPLSPAMAFLIIALGLR